MSPRGLNLERNWRSRLQIQSPMRILHATKANRTNTVGPCIHSTCSSQNSIGLGSVPKNQHINIRTETKPISCTKSILSCQNLEILYATNAPHALPASLFTRETFLSGFHLETVIGFLEIFIKKNLKHFVI